MPFNTHLTLRSANAKTGPIPVSTSSIQTCPPSCLLKEAGCYANSGPLAIHWKAVNEGRRGTRYTKPVEAGRATERAKAAEEQVSPV